METSTTIVTKNYMVLLNRVKATHCIDAIRLRETRKHLVGHYLWYTLFLQLYGSIHIDPNDCSNLCFLFLLIEFYLVVESSSSLVL